MRFDVYPESFIGVVATDREFADTFSRLGGVDGQFKIGRNHRLGFRALATDMRTDAGERHTGSLLDVGLVKEGRNLSYGLIHYEIHPEFGTTTGFVRRVDTKETIANVGYRWWPEGWVINWGPRVSYMRNYDYRGVLQDERLDGSTMFQFARSIFTVVGVNRGLERFLDVDFDQTRFFAGFGVNTSRKIGFGGFVNGGDQIRYVEDPFLGRGANYNLFFTLRPVARLQSQINVASSRFLDSRDNTEIFNVKIYRALTTFQFSERLLARNILEYNTLARTGGVNLLLTYRVNAGTVFYVGYDDHYQQANLINAELFSSSRFQRTNRAIFTKLQYLFRL
jgi:hypothetical protein